MKMHVIFVGHGSPMIAIQDNDITRKFKDIGDKIINKYDKPSAILMVSAHWFTDGNLIQSVEKPKQIFDMYGFPKELYEVKYEAKGNLELTKKVLGILGDDISVNNDWGIDHGAWSVLIHMFPKADIPVVQLSVNKNLSEDEIFNLGKKLSILSDDGYLIIGSGNVVHNLAMVEWDNEFGSIYADEFDEEVKKNILSEDYIEVINGVKQKKNYNYAVPTKEHFYPLLYILGASAGRRVTIFNNIRDLGSISMTSHLFE